MILAFLAFPLCRVFSGVCPLLGCLPIGCFCALLGLFFLASCGVSVGSWFVPLYSLSRHFGGSPHEFILLSYLSKKRMINF